MDCIVFNLDFPLLIPYAYLKITLGNIKTLTGKLHIIHIWSKQPCRTLIWFFPSVNPHMFIKSTFINKGFITITTFVWFLPSMDPHILAKNTCIDMVCLQYESSYVCQFYSSLQKLSHIGYICMVSPQYEWSYVCQVYSSLQKLSHIGYICIVSPQYECSYGNQEHFYLRRLYHNYSTGMVCLQHECLYIIAKLSFV